MTNEEIQELLDAAKPSIIESLKRELTQNITYEVKQQTQQVVRDHVMEWVKINIIPEITKSLVESKDGMVAIGVALAPKIVDEITKAMTVAISENLSQSWTRKKLFEALID